MAKVKVTGIRKVDFKDDQGRQVQGSSLYYLTDLSPANGLFAQGYYTNKEWLKGGSQLEAQMLALNYDVPFDAEFIYDVLPGSKRPVLAEVKLVK